MKGSRKLSAAERLVDGLIFVGLLGVFGAVGAGVLLALFALRW